VLGGVLNEFDPKMAGERRYAYNYSYKYVSTRPEGNRNGQIGHSMPPERALSDKEG
jgi:hypothetical protein